MLETCVVFVLNTDRDEIDVFRHEAAGCRIPGMLLTLDAREVRYRVPLNRVLQRGMQIRRCDDSLLYREDPTCLEGIVHHAEDLRGKRAAVRHRHELADLQHVENVYRLVIAELLSQKRLISTSASFLAAQTISPSQNNSGMPRARALPP